MTKRNLLILVILVVLIGSAAALKFIFKPAASPNPPGHNATSTPVTAVGLEYGDSIRQAMLANKSFGNFSGARIGITSHHLPTAISLIAELYNTLIESKSPDQVFVVIGPDHYEHCKRDVSTTKRPYLTPFGILVSNSEIISDLEKNSGVSEVDSCFDGEHSVGVHSMFIKLLFPNSTIVPLIYSSAATESSIKKVATGLAKYQDKITVVVSVDFSHYKSTDEANRLDAESGKMIEALDGGGLTLEHMDSPASIRTAIELAKLWGLKPNMLKHDNSYDFTGQSQNTTGYWDVIFAK